MSLKAFHVFFIVACILLMLGLGAWGIRDFRASGATFSLYLAIGSLACCATLVVYGRWFLRKLRDYSYV